MGTPLLLPPTVDVICVCSHRTALSEASKAKHLSVVKLLLRCDKTNVTLTDTEGNTALENANRSMDVRWALGMRSTLLWSGPTCCLDVKNGIFRAASDGDHREGICT